MKTSRALHVGVALGAVAGSILLLAERPSHARGGATSIVIEGTGTFDSQVVRTQNL